jgi:two-component system, cell cycle response regulator
MTPSSVIDLRDLRLDDARALVGHDPANRLSELENSPTQLLQSILDGLCELSLKDPLTGLANRRHFHTVLSREIDVAARSGEPALLLLLDIDHFKKVNDTYGHHAGDLVLQAIANCLASCVRPMDTVARYGGEEFAVILPSCLASFGRIVAERMAIPVSPVQDIKVTVSIGGSFAPIWIRSTPALWVERADALLYKAKDEGRDRVFIDVQQEISVSAEEKNMLFGHLAAGDPAWIESIGSDASKSAASGTTTRVN